jgi:hypothetical protein
VIVNLSETAGNVVLNSLSGLMDGGSIELLSNQGEVLAVLKLSDPAAQDAIGGELELNKIAEEDAALAQGNAISARVVASDGSEVFSCDVGDENSDAVTTAAPRCGSIRSG